MGFVPRKPEIYRYKNVGEVLNLADVGWDYEKNLTNHGFIRIF
jgi:hypothetical protein